MQYCMHIQHDHNRTSAYKLKLFQASNLDVSLSLRKTVSTVDINTFGS